MRTSKSADANTYEVSIIALVRALIPKFSLDRMVLLYSCVYCTSKVCLPAYYFCGPETNECSLIWSGINVAMKISLVFSFVEYFGIAFGYVHLYRRVITHSPGRKRNFFYMGIILSPLAGITALISFGISFVPHIGFDLILFQWVSAILYPLEYMEI
jgi:hypothetical protein